jgi:hypothetical protein
MFIEIRSSIIVKRTSSELRRSSIFVDHALLVFLCRAVVQSCSPAVAQSYNLQPRSLTAYSLQPNSLTAYSLIFLEILFKFNQTETSVATQIMINTIGSRIFCHRRGILEFIEQILREVHLGIPELLDTLALIHNIGSN